LILLRQVDDNGVITSSKFKTFGCGSAIASSSLATEWVKGKTLNEVLAIKNKDIAGYLKVKNIRIFRKSTRQARARVCKRARAALHRFCSRASLLRPAVLCLSPSRSVLAPCALMQLPPVKLHCSMLAEDAIKAAVKDYRDKQVAKA